MYIVFRGNEIWYNTANGNFYFLHSCLYSLQREFLFKYTVTLLKCARGLYSMFNDSLQYGSWTEK